MTYNWKRLPKTRRKVIKKTIKTFGGVCLFYVPISLYLLLQFGDSNKATFITVEQSVVCLGILLLVATERMIVEDLCQEERDFIFESYSKIVRANMDPLMCSTPQVEQRVRELLEVESESLREGFDELYLWDFDELNKVFIEDFRNALYRS
jgi:hypothetical protein